MSPKPGTLRPSFTIRGGFVKYLVTEEAGFSGSNLTDALVARGNHVVPVDDPPAGSVPNVWTPVRPLRQIVEDMLLHERIPAFES